MDITEKYIKMCRKAVEILWKPSIGDYVYSIEYEKVFLITNYTDTLLLCVLLDRTDREFLPKKKKCIWLPTQDQLQEMLKPNNFFWDSMGMEGVLREMRDVYGILLETPLFDSGEQFWLAYVMYKKFGKIWNGKNWITKGGEND